MADLEDVTLDGRPLHSLRVADLKAALEERGLPKSGQKNALVKRLKGALMVENLQKTFTPYDGLQPNSQISEEMSQNSLIQQYLAKQQELLRQLREREALQANDTNEQEERRDVNNSIACPSQAQDVTPASADQHKPPEPSDGGIRFSAVTEGEANNNQEAHMSAPPASVSITMHVPGNEHQPEKSSAASDFPADSDDDDSEDGEEDGDDDDDWGSNVRRKTQKQPARGPSTRERCGASRQPQQPQHIPSLLSPQLRQPTPPPSPPPELSFSLPDTPKQSPPGLDVAPARHSPSNSSSGSSSSGSRSSSPEPQRSGHVERKPGPLSLLARKMESEGAFSGAFWPGGNGEGSRKDNNPTIATSFCGTEHVEGLSLATAAGHVPVSMRTGINQGIIGTHSAQSHIPVSVLKTSTVEGRESELESEKVLELHRPERLRSLEQERALEEERKRALQWEQKEMERFERQQVLERQEREALQSEKKLASERERLEREQSLAWKQEEREQTLAREQAMALERQREMEKQRALEQERLQREREEMEKQAREMELERIQALEREREQREKALEKEMLERAKALEAERKDKERALEQERLEREKLEQQRLEREREALEKQRREQEALEKERREREEALRKQKERALEQERLHRMQVEKERLERERLERERLERERLERERLEREHLERERLQRERLERERLERERLERERERLEQERLERERLEHLEKTRVEQERLEKERLARACAKQEQLAPGDRTETQGPVNLDRKDQERGEALENRLEDKIAVARASGQEMLEKKTAKELDIELPLSLTSPAPPLFTGLDRKTVAEVQEDAKAPSESQAAESRSPLASPPSSLKKFRFLRDPPVQAQSTTSMVIKRHRTFSDTPQTQVSLFSSSSPAGFGEQRESQTSAQQEVSTKTQGLLGCRSEEESAFHNKTSSKEGLAAEASQENAKDGSVRQDELAKGSSKTLKDVTQDQVAASPANAVQRREKRSSSNDSASSESDSGSSSSRSSSSSSSSSHDKISTSKNRREGNRDSTSAQCQVTAVAQADSIKETQKSVEKTSTADDEASQAKKPFLETTAGDEMKSKDGEGLEPKDESSHGIESAMAESEKLVEASEEAYKAFSPRKISLSSNKSSPGTGSTDGDQESGTAGGRKRRWGSCTAVTGKKPSISITTDSLKSLIPDVRPGSVQDAVVDLHPEEVVLSDTEEESQETSEQDLQIRRTVTQEVPSESQENGQKQTKRRRCEHVEENDIQGDHNRTQSHEDKPEEDMETQSPVQPTHDGEISTAVESSTLIRRSISQQKSGVSITIDDPVRTTQQPSPPRGKVSSIVHVSNLVRPFTLGQLKELLGRTGTLVEDGFWIDKIKSHCYVTYSSSEEAIATREALHGVKWPQSNPKVLNVDFSQQDELDFHKGLGAAEKPGTEEQWPASNRFQAASLPPLLPKRDQWAEREREMERREKARSEREWDRDKVREFGKAANDGVGDHRRSRSRERRRKERGKSKEKKTEKKEKAAEEPPAKLLDDLFRKTKATPCIYWLPLTDEQFVEREAARAERMKEREQRLKQQQQQEEEEEEKKSKEERKEKSKGGALATGERSEGAKDKDRERERDRDRGREREKDRETDKYRDGYRRPGASGDGGSRRSRSRSDPRDRRR
ncbi:apoptotic chromatin condensation inducer in the nucleus [Syngnathus acus]|uniref:apoptotic chromatin condensation inducer in the nucleus n=1 Tax=Syngnathus acus TaxID=161584 RepID=UPI0018860059|nr:apoptotic chromatin condensation inducer in the nucleus [Syngnathus acus]